MMDTVSLDISHLQVTMAEDSISSPADLSRDDSSDLGGGSDSLQRRGCVYFLFLCFWYACKDIGHLNMLSLFHASFGM